MFVWLTIKGNIETLKSFVSWNDHPLGICSRDRDFRTLGKAAELEEYKSLLHKEQKKGRRAVVKSQCIACAISLCIEHVLMRINL